MSPFTWNWLTSHFKDPKSLFLYLLQKIISKIFNLFCLTKSNRRFRIFVLRKDTFKKLFACISSQFLKFFDRFDNIHEKMTAKQLSVCHRVAPVNWNHAAPMQIVLFLRMTWPWLSAFAVTVLLAMDRVEKLFDSPKLWFLNFSWFWKF